MKKIILFCVLCTASLIGLEEEDLVFENQGPSVQEFNGYLQQALSDKNWWAVIDYANILSYNFSTSPFAQDASFLMGEAYFNLGHLELSNECLSTYLKHTTSPRRFEEAIAYKFDIAEQFKNGTKKPLFGSHKLPKLIPAQEDAIAIYDEVITTLPHSDYAVRSLLSKAQVQAQLEDYKPSIETLDVLIRRFPKHDLAAEAHLQKVLVYLMQCQGRNLDPDLLDLADVGIRKFKLSFPREPRIGEAENALFEMQEIFASNLLETGRFFEKTKKIPASTIYYNKVIAKYPKTQAAASAKERLEALSPTSI